MFRSVDTPWKPATTGTMPASMASRSRSGRISRILALVCSVSVMIPAWLPGEGRGLDPESASAMQSRLIEMRSPEVSSMSISRAGIELETSSARRSRSSVDLAHGRHHDDDVVALAPGARHVVGDGADAVGVADGGAAELLDDECHGLRTYLPRRSSPDPARWRE